MTSIKPVSLIMHDVRTIVDFLSQKLQLGLVPENINYPTAETVQQIYYNFMIFGLDVTDAALTTLPMNVNADYDPELHRKSISIALLYHSMKSFILDCTGEKINFCMCDLVNPAADVPKLRRLLSFLVDFIKLREVAKPIFTEVTEEFRESNQRFYDLQDEMREVETRKNTLIAEQASRKRRENDLLNEIQKNEDELNAIVKNYEMKTTLTEEAKKIMEKSIVDTQKLESEMDGMRKMIEHLSTEVLSSPNRMRSEMEERKKQIIVVEQHISDLKDELKKRYNDLDICANADKEINRMSEKCQALGSETAEVWEMMATVDDEERKLNELEQQLKFLCDKQKASLDIMVEMTENHERFMNEHLGRMKVLESEAAEIRRNISEMCRQQPQASKDIEEKNAQLLRIRNSASEIKSKTMKECEEMVVKFDKIMNVYDMNERQSIEHSNAVSRVLEKLKSSVEGGIKLNFTFSTSTICDYTRNEDDKENTENENVFK